MHRFVSCGDKTGSALAGVGEAPADDRREADSVAALKFVVPNGLGAAPEPLERRRAHRHRTLLAAQLGYGDPMLTMACGVRNLSEGGAQIKLGVLTVLSEPIRLLLPRDGVAIDVTIAWQRRDLLGVAFGEHHDLRGRVTASLRPLQNLWKEMQLR